MSAVRRLRVSAGAGTEAIPPRLLALDWNDGEQELRLLLGDEALKVD